MSSFRKIDNRFDRLAPKYSQIVENSFPIAIDHQLFARTKVRVLLRAASRAGLTAGSLRILDVGCGTGLVHPYLAREVASVVGIDVSEKSLTIARSNNPSVLYRAFDGGAFPFDDGTFDLTCAICLFHHVQPHLWSSLVAEMTRVTAPGGVVAIIEHNPYNPLTQYVVRNNELDEGVKLLRPGKSRRLLVEEGTEKVAVRYFQFLPSERALLQVLERYLSWLPIGAQYLVEGRV